MTVGSWGLLAKGQPDGSLPEASKVGSQVVGTFDVLGRFRNSAMSGMCYDSFHARSQTRPCARSALDDPRCFIVDAPHVTSRHVTHSHHSHLQMHASASWHTRPLVVREVFLPAL